MTVDYNPNLNKKRYFLASLWNTAVQSQQVDKLVDACNEKDGKPFPGRLSWVDFTG